jgi:hypothetical protein
VPPLEGCVWRPATCFWGAIVNMSRQSVRWQGSAMPRAARHTGMRGRFPAFPFSADPIVSKPSGKPVSAAVCGNFRGYAAVWHANSRDETIGWCAGCKAIPGNDAICAHGANQIFRKCYVVYLFCC